MLRICAAALSLVLASLVTAQPTVVDTANSSDQRTHAKKGVVAPEFCWWQKDRNPPAGANNLEFCIDLEDGIVEFPETRLSIAIVAATCSANNGKLTVNSSDQIVCATDTFIEHSDTPPTFTGYANFVPHVNSAENALEWSLMTIEDETTLSVIGLWYAGVEAFRQTVTRIAGGGQGTTYRVELEDGLGDTSPAITCTTVGLTDNCLFDFRIDAGTDVVQNVQDPVAAQDAATKNYVDGANIQQLYLVGSGVDPDTVCSGSGHASCLYSFFTYADVPYVTATSVASTSITTSCSTGWDPIGYMQITVVDGMAIETFVSGEVDYTSATPDASIDIGVDINSTVQGCDNIVETSNFFSRTVGLEKAGSLIPSVLSTGGTYYISLCGCLNSGAVSVRSWRMYTKVLDAITPTDCAPITWTAGGGWHSVICQ